MMKKNNLFGQYREQIAYLFVGGITSVIGMGGYWLLVALGMSPVGANVLSWVFAVIFAYFANKSLVFLDKTSGLREVLRQACTFVSSRVFSLVVETALIWAGIQWLQLDKYLVKIPVAVVVVVLNYITGKFIVFRKNRR